MKVIDILNKLAKGEELPRKLKGNNHTYTLVENCNYEDEDGDILFSDDYFWCNEDFLNEELKIIEEDKKIEKLDLRGYYDKDIQDNNEWLTSEEILALKINELIDKVNKLKGGLND